MVLLLAVLVLAATGRLNWLVALGAALLPVLGRLAGLLLTVLPAWQRYQQTRRQAGGRPSGGGRSVVETRFLRMTLDHDSGEMGGQVLAGAFAGRSLDQLSVPQLRELLAQLRRDDEESAALLLAYLERVHGDEWRQAEAGGEGAQARAGGGEMSLREALDILGLAEGAGEDEVREAHRRLMQKLHPDRGGSTYLASKINQAKDRLLRDSKR